MDIKFECQTVSLESARSGHGVTLNAEGVRLPDILSQISITDIVNLYGEEDLLKEIGKDCAMAFWESL